MEEYEFAITMKVRVEAFDQSDAQDAIIDLFGVGADCGVTIDETEIKYLGVSK